MGALHEAETLTDVPSISMVQADLLVAVLERRNLHGTCAPATVCPDWARVRVLVELKRDGFLIVVDRDVRLTPKGRDWAEAFAPFVRGKS